MVVLGEVFYQYRVVKPIAGNAFRKGRVLGVGLDIPVKNFPLHISGQQLCQQFVPGIGRMDLIGRPDINRPQPSDIGDLGQLIISGAEADLGYAIGLVDGSLGVLNIVAVQRAYIGVDGGDTVADQLAKDPLIGFRTVG